MASPHRSLAPSPTTTISDLTGPLEEIKHDLTLSARSVISPEAKDVTWDGPNDPNNPQNWSYGYKWFITLICGLLTLNVYVLFLSEPLVLVY